MLYDVLAKLNAEIRDMMVYGADAPRLIGITDGEGVQVTFMDKVVWDSANWEDDCDFIFGEDAKVKHELSRIESHIKSTVMEHLMKLFDIQW